MPGEHGLLNQLSRVHLGSQAEAASMGSPQGSAPGLCIYVVAVTLVFLWDSELWEQVCL